ncbi:hypothetical protein MKW92_032234, partial [Papaver armeniacum]
FVSDNGSNFKAAGKLLMREHPTLFWTPCAAHRIISDERSLRPYSTDNQSYQQGQVACFLHLQPWSSVNNV